MKFKQVINPYDDRLPKPWGRKGAFYAQDYSRMMSNTAKRARKLAKPTWDAEVGRDGQDFSDLLKEEEYLNRHVNFSFEYQYKDSGDWSNYKDYAIDVPNKANVEIPEKEAMTFKENIIPITSIGRKSVL